MLLCGCGAVIECALLRNQVINVPTDNGSLQRNTTPVEKESPRNVTEPTTTPGYRVETEVQPTAHHASNLSTSETPESANKTKASPDHTDGRQKPKLEYIVFQGAHSTSAPDSDQGHVSVHFTAQELQEYDAHLVRWVSVLGVGCFLFGMICASLAAYILYKRQKRKWKRIYKRRYSLQRATPVYENIETWQPTNQHQPKPVETANPYSDYFRYKEGLIPTNDMRTLFSNHVSTSLAEEDPHESLHRYECQSVFPHLTTYNGERYPFINQFSRIITSDGGEISSPYSDVAVFVIPRAIRRGTSRQIFVNVALQADLFLQEYLNPSGDDSSKLSINLQALALENLGRKLVQLSPVVECISPGVTRFARPLAIRIPHRANVASDNSSSVGWELQVLHSCSSLGTDMSWSLVPNEDSLKAEESPDATYSSDQDSVYIRTCLPGSWAVLGRPKGKHSALRLCAVAYAQCKLPSCHPAQQGLQVVNCDNQTSFPDLIVPTTSQTHYDNRGPAGPFGFSVLRDFHKPKPAVSPICMNSQDNAQPVRLAVYICDPYMDAHKVGLLRC